MTGVEKHDVVCPHCKKSFQGELIGSDASRRGFKCPHCRLFVPLERAETETDG
jgi:transposase-like protein